MTPVLLHHSSTESPLNLNNLAHRMSNLQNTTDQLTDAQLQQKTSAQTSTHDKQLGINLQNKKHLLALSPVPNKNSSTNMTAALAHQTIQVDDRYRQMQFNTPEKQQKGHNQIDQQSGQYHLQSNMLQSSSKFGMKRLQSMQFSRQVSDVTSQMSQSNMSTISTKDQVGKAKEVILKALHLKKLGCVREQTELISAQPFMKGTCNERHLRIWMKAFIEQMSPIVNQFKDQRLLELLLFDLPWLCHGVDKSISVRRAGAGVSGGGISNQSQLHLHQSRLTTGQISAFNLQSTSCQEMIPDGLSQSQRSLFSQGIAGTSLARMPSLPSDFNGSSQGGNNVAHGRISATNSVRSSVVNPIHAKNATMSFLLSNSNWSFSPCCTHGHQFELFGKLAFAVIPQQISLAHRILKHTFTHIGQFFCKNERCYGNAAAKNSPAISPPTLMKIFKEKIQRRLEQKEQKLVSQMTAQEKQKTTSNQISLGRDKSNFKSLEELFLKAETTLKEIYKAALKSQNQKQQQDSTTNASSVTDSHMKGDKKKIQVHNEVQKVFFAAFYDCFQALKKDKNSVEQSDRSLKELFIWIEGPEKAPKLIVDNEKISLKDCLVGLQTEYQWQMLAYANAYIQQTQVKRICQFIVKLVSQYPFLVSQEGMGGEKSSSNDLCLSKLIQDNFPHQNSPIEQLVIYQQIVNEIIEGLLKKVSKMAKAEIQRLQKQDQRMQSQSKPLAPPRSKNSQQTPFQDLLKRVLKMESKLLHQIVDKILALDASSKKWNPRRGANYPDKEGHSWIQPQAEYKQEVFHRFYNEKEAKNTLLMHNMMTYLCKRFEGYSKKYEHGVEKVRDPNEQGILFDSLFEIFRSKIFVQTKAKFLQYVPLLIIGYSSENLANSSSERPVSLSVTKSCNIYTQKILSMLIREAFMLNKDGQVQTQPEKVKGTFGVRLQRSNSGNKGVELNQTSSVGDRGGTVNIQNGSVNNMSTDQSAQAVVRSDEIESPQNALDRRMKAMNYIGSILTQDLVSFNERNLIKCIELILKKQKQLVQEAQQERQKAMGQNAGESQHLSVNLKSFQHCFAQNLALIFSVHQERILMHSQTLHDEITKCLFQRRQCGSLEFASPFILEQLINCTKRSGSQNGPNDNLQLLEKSNERVAGNVCGEEQSRNDGAPDSRQMTYLARRVQKCIESQEQAVKTHKMAIYQKIARWMPFSTPLFIEQIVCFFQDLKQRSQSSMNNPPLPRLRAQQTQDDNIQMTNHNSGEEEMIENENEESKSSTGDLQIKLRRTSSSNILNEPTPHSILPSPCQQTAEISSDQNAYNASQSAINSGGLLFNSGGNNNARQLQHRKSIHECELSASPQALQPTRPSEISSSNSNQKDQTLKPFKVDQTCGNGEGKSRLSIGTLAASISKTTVVNQPAESAPSGLVSQAFRSQNKFTSAAMARKNPALVRQIIEKNTKVVPNRTLLPNSKFANFSASESNNSSSVMSDSMTVISPEDQPISSSGSSFATPKTNSSQMRNTAKNASFNNGQSNVATHNNSSSHQQYMKKVVRADIEKGRRNLTMSLQQANLKNQTNFSKQGQDHRAQQRQLQNSQQIARQQMQQNNQYSTTNQQK